MSQTKTTPTPYSAAQFVRWYKEGSLDLSPDFQRRSVWKPGAKSYLIDTLLKGFPVPPIYLRDRPTNLKTLQTPKEVVDGQQRLRTVIAFIDPEALREPDPDHDFFTISDAHSEEFADLAFKDLPEDARQTILDYQFPVHTFTSDTSDSLILQIFARMNATGIKLNAQELRNAEFYGHFKTLSYALASEQIGCWLSWRVFTSSQIARMDEVEFTSDLLGLIIHGITAKTPKAIHALYKDLDKTFNERKEVGRRFRFLFDEFELQINDSLKLGPLSQKAIFYAAFAAAYDYSYGLNSSLSQIKGKKLPKGTIQKMVQAASEIAGGTVPQRVVDATSVRVTHASARRILTEFLRDKI